MLKEIVLIHPLGQVVALLFGVFNLVTGWTRKCFILPVHGIALRWKMGMQTGVFSASGRYNESVCHEMEFFSSGGLVHWKQTGQTVPVDWS